jgi:hypothetical protein
MTFDKENVGSKINTLAYEQPTLKKYGSMKDLTFQSSGSITGGIFDRDTDGRRITQENGNDESTVFADPREINDGISF